MPVKITAAAGEGQDYGSPFVGPLNHTHSLSVNLANLTNAEIDAKGYVKPGVPLRSTGALVSGAGQVIFGCVVEAVKVAADNAAGTIAALGTIDLAVATIGQVNRDLLEDILGRVLTADELSAFGAAGCHLVLLA